MNSLSRFFLNPAAWGDGPLVLSSEESHHCVRVLRQKVGDEVVVFDGEGRSVQGEIVEASKQEVMVQPTASVMLQERSNEIRLIQAVPKAGNMELIVQKAVELGIASIQPLETDNTVAKADAKKVEKWQRVALEACKQCGQNYLPQVMPAMKFSEWIQEDTPAQYCVVAALDPRSEPIEEVLAALSMKQSVGLLVGPEGDFSAGEYDAAIAAGYLPVSLGSIVLRVETATLYCLSILKFALARLT
ncbi:16S rRNA (uracil(1498)-N(3))-methyltransferase [Rubritalea marina]|uniref:16S rRNA (uracil(1498)-N(3))-methyltransferase n=1 Tax=Rubritalea marina TaxID=361055 RepID=UPI0003A9967D|nr:16S rRNA (uracil(1498)-N(3))-methyltransferase [Rubritalea marina]